MNEKTFLLGNRHSQGVILTPNKWHFCCFIFTRMRISLSYHGIQTLPFIQTLKLHLSHRLLLLLHRNRFSQRPPLSSLQRKFSCTFPPLFSLRWTVNDFGIQKCDSHLKIHTSKIHLNSKLLARTCFTVKGRWQS